MRVIKTFALPALAVAAAAMLASCSVKKNTAASRQWQAFTTRYNTYFNGSEHYKEQLKRMEESYEDDYTRLLLPHPAEARGADNTPQPQGDFTRTIEKMQKAIQLHSIKRRPQRRSRSAEDREFRKREEFNPFLHKAWLLMGRSQYMNGDFGGAATTFGYIAKHFPWLPEVVTEAKIWQARSHAAQGWLYEAEDLLRRIPYDKIENKELKADYALAKASLLTRRGQFEEAIPYLREAAEEADGIQSNRLWFLLGQAEQRAGHRQEAYNAYRKAGGGIGTPYRTKLNARIRQSEVYPGGDFRKEIKSLEGLARYARNEEYLDQIFYAIGNIWLSHGDTVPALENYRRAIASSTREGIDKAVAQIAMANLCFELGRYVEAQPAYSEGLAGAGETWPEYARLRRRSDVLDELAVFASTVELQDSLLDLAALSPDEQRRTADRLAREFRRAKRDSQQQAAPNELMELQGGGAAEPTAYSLGSADDSWYFYNRDLKEAGKKAFQKRWGTRRLEDDWRRSNKAHFALETPEEDTENPDGTEESKTAETNKEDQQKLIPENPEYYLTQIPNTPEQKEASLNLVDNGLFNMGLILKDRLDDPTAARKSLKEQITRFPDSPNRLEALHNLYLIAARLGEDAEAAAMASMIVESFPDSPLAAELADGNHIQRLRRMIAEESERYEAAYDAYLADENGKLHELVEQMERDYPTSELMPRFVLLDALSAASQGDESNFKERLNQLLSRWPEAEMSEMAAGMMANLNKGLRLQQGVSNPRGVLWSQRLSEADAETDSATTAAPAAFGIDEEGPQYFVLVYPRDEVNANALLFEVAKFNFSTFTVKEFDLEPMNFGNVGLLIIKDFNGKQQLDAYRRMMARAEGGLSLPPEVRPVDISKADFELLLREGRSFDDYFSFLESREVEAID